MKAFFHAVAFLTRLPVPRLSTETRDWTNSVAYYPVVGVILGFILWGITWLASALFPPVVASILVLGSWVYLTGGLHLDGWMDVADGLGSNRDRERMLAIMKDSRVGAMGVIACVLLLLFKGAAILELSHSAAWLVAATAGARFALTGVIWFFPYLSERGLGSGLRDGLSPWKLIAGGIVTLGVIAWLVGVGGLLAFGAALLGAWLVARSLVSKLGGMTGDCYGTIVEGTEAMLLAFLLIVERIGL
ncbi:adenosylcobinamide-GDP ribazoletransferase [Brevibacillus fluminis]|uniref:Adenosylcobinamide-GDP ribazoletransferase n=1 Tax=Brevibacillus fluminis TaxID=511487 RepID=A0A3M8CWJ4_9BACL|nr:adenosylcobinamide-GDP ribazoletransferase [Brevibacillus fluminis]RNB80134.1 adenosylcobinamide-GDP ribazoletransferase [Brevibacillus fluminis]